MPLVGNMPAAELTGEQKQLNVRSEHTKSTLAEKARETFTEAGAAVKNAFQTVTEPLTHAQQKQDEKHAIEEQKLHECEENCLCEQHNAAVRCPSLHDKTKIHFMMEAKHNDNFVPLHDEKFERQPVPPPTIHKSTMESVKEVFKGKSEDIVEQEALMEQHKAALANPSACDKTKFAFL